MKKSIKLNRTQLRSIIKEAIQVRQPGQREPYAVDEAWGAYDAEGPPGQEHERDVDYPGEMTMHPLNFENTHKELFSQALDSVIDIFVDSLTDVHSAGFDPSGDASAKREAQEVGEQLRAKLMEVIKKYTEIGTDRML